MAISQKDFIEKVIRQYEESMSNIESMTDQVFLMIQNDRELFHEWLDLLEKNKRNIINSLIAKAVKKKFYLNNKKNAKKNVKNKKPKSMLIKSFQEFKK
jgi:hypothetical protein